MQETGLATAQALPAFGKQHQEPREGRPAVLRLRCYLPSSSTIIILGIVAYVLLRSANRASQAIAGQATEIIAIGLAAVTAVTIAVSVTVIRRRRAAAGACHTCSHPCRGAIEPLPERDAQLSPGGRPPVPPGVRVGGPDRKNRDLIRAADTNEGCDRLPSAHGKERHPTGTGRTNGASDRLLSAHGKEERHPTGTGRTREPLPLTVIVRGDSQPAQLRVPQQGHRPNPASPTEDLPQAPQRPHAALAHR
jgi:hypothetical protein